PACRSGPGPRPAKRRSEVRPEPGQRPKRLVGRRVVRLHLSGDVAELSVQVGAEGAETGDDRESDERSDEPVLDRGGAVAVAKQLIDEGAHGCLLLVGERPETIDLDLFMKSKKRQATQ